MFQARIAQLNACSSSITWQFQQFMLLSGHTDLGKGGCYLLVRPHPRPIRLAYGNITYEDAFIYLGSTFTTNGSLDAELKRRSNRTKAALQELDKTWRQRKVHISVKMMVYRAIGPPTLLYGAETWPVTEQQAHQLDVVQNDCLRLIAKVRPADHVTLSNLRQQCHQQPSIPDLLRTYRLRFLGHLARRPTHRLPKQLLFAKFVPDATNGLPKQRTSIIDTMRMDLEHVEESNGWLELAQDRARWRAMIADKCVSK